jgi:hypothetical protein
VKIKNPTHWKTQDIAGLIYRVAQDELDKGALKFARVRIVYGRKNSGALGWCTYGTGLRPNVNMWLVLPKPGERLDIVKVAKVIAHELGHAKGLRHRDMRNTRYGWVEGWRERYAWAVDYEFGMRPEPAKKSREEQLVERRSKAVIKAEKMVRKWTITAKRSNTMLKKWQTRLKAASRRTTLLPVSTTAPQVETMLATDNCEAKIPSLVS